MNLATYIGVGLNMSWTPTMRQRVALKMRESGATYALIAKALSITRQGAYQLCRRATRGRYRKHVTD